MQPRSLYFLRYVAVYQKIFALIWPILESRAGVTWPKRVVDIASGIVELGVIENVEELSPDLKPGCLGDARSLGQAEVGIVQSRAVEKLTAGSAALPKAARCKGTG